MESGKTELVKTFQMPKELKDFLDNNDNKSMVVLEFMSPGEFPSKSMEQPYKEVASEFRPKEVEFVAVPYNKFQNLAQKLGVDAVPMFLLMNGRKVLDRFVVRTKKELTTKIENKLKNWKSETGGKVNTNLAGSLESY